MVPLKSKGESFKYIVKWVEDCYKIDKKDIIINIQELVNQMDIIDLFCGKGTFLGVCNERNLSSIGVEWNYKRCKQSLRLKLDELV